MIVILEVNFGRHGSLMDSLHVTSQMCRRGDGPKPLTREFSLPPPFGGSWRNLGSSSTQLTFRLLQRLEESLVLSEILGDNFNARCQALQFYGDDWFFVDLEFRTLEGVGACGLVVGPRRAVFASGLSGDVLALNDELSMDIKVGDIHAAAYLRYFTANAWGPEGPFRIVEDPAEARAQAHFAGTETDVLPICLGDSPDGPVLQAHVSYGGALFVASFRFEAAGRVVMVDDDERAIGSSKLIFRRPLRLLPYASHPSEAP